MSDLTRILSQIESGDPSSADKLLRMVYDELRKPAAAKLAHEMPDESLPATTRLGSRHAVRNLSNLAMAEFSNDHR